MIIIDGVKIQTGVVEVSKHETDETKIEVELEFTVIGESNYNLYNNVLKNGPVKIDIPEKSISIFGKRENYRRSYQGQLDDDTSVKFSVVYLQCEENEVDWNTDKGLAFTNIMNWVRTRAISEILIDNGLVTEEEYLKKIDDVYLRDRIEMAEYISTGKSEEE